MKDWPTMLLGIPVVIDSDVSLERLNPETGEREPALCWKLGDRILVHPDRWEDFERAMIALQGGRR